MKVRLNPMELAVLNTFKTDCCDVSKTIDPSQVEDWISLSIGYFIAKGIRPKRAHKLALYVRYELHYWS